MTGSTEPSLSVDQLGQTFDGRPCSAARGRSRRVGAGSPERRPRSNLPMCRPRRQNRCLAAEIVSGRQDRDLEHEHAVAVGHPGIDPPTARHARVPGGGVRDRSPASWTMAPRRLPSGRGAPWPASISARLRRPPDRSSHSRVHLRSISSGSGRGSAGPIAHRSKIFSDLLATNGLPKAMQSLRPA